MMSIFENIGCLFLDDKYSDFAVHCGGRVFKIHRAIICPQSTLFQKVCDSGFQESQTGVLQLSDEDDPIILEKFLSCLYTGNYEDAAYPTSGPSAAALLSKDDINDYLVKEPPVLKGEETADFDEIEYEPSEDGNEYSDDDSLLDEAARDEEGEGNDREQEEEESDAVSQDDDQRVAGAYLPELRTPSKGPDEQSLGQEDEEWVDRDRQSLLQALQIYTMADRFDASGARLLVRERFYRAAQDLLSFAETGGSTFELNNNIYTMFADAVDMLFSNTAPTDFSMREFPCRMIGDRYHNKALQDKIVPVMRKHGDLAVGVLQNMMDEV